MRITSAVAATALAVVVVSAGSATAGTLVTTKMLKNNAVTTPKIKNNAVTTQKVQDGTLGLADLAPSVRAAIQAPRNSAVTSTRLITGPDVVVAAGEVGTATAFCPGGTHPTGGGFFSSITLTAASMPSGSTVDARGNGWAVIVTNTASFDATINAYVICA